jgi:hypothetical protein
MTPQAKKIEALLQEAQGVPGTDSIQDALPVVLIMVMLGIWDSVQDLANETYELRKEIQSR